MFLLLAYGLPLIAIREASQRWQLSYAGLFVLGLAYGFFNEGLLAQTLMRSDNVPIDSFNHYLVFAGFNFSWMSLIVPWHALLAVVFPITLVGHWYPSCARVAWLRDRTFRVLSSLVLAMVAFLALVRAPHAQMAACGAAIALLSCLASRLRQGGTVRPSLRGAFALGSGLYLLTFLGLVFLAGLHAVPAVFFGAAAAILGLLLIAGRRRDWLRSPAAARLALGAYFTAALFNLLGGLHRHSSEAAVTGSALAVAFAVLALISRLLPREIRLAASQAPGFPA